jgi:signal transduction histidine kinase
MNNSKKLLRNSQWKLAFSYANIMGILYILISVYIYYFTSRDRDMAIDREITFIANTVHNRLEPILSMPDRLGSSIREVFPDFCIDLDCQHANSNRQHITNTFSAADRYHLVLIDNSGKIRAMAGNVPAKITFSKFDGAEVWITQQDPQGKSYRQYATVAHAGGIGSPYPVWGKLYIGRNTEDIDNALHSLKTALILGFPLVLLMIGGISWYLADRAMHPLYLAYERQQIFAANVAHELRTPLAIDRLNIDKYIAKFEIQHPPAAVALNELRNQNVRLANIVTDLLLLTQLERTNFSIEECILCSLDEVVEDVIEELSILHNDYPIMIDIPKSIKPVTVRGNQERITRLVYNLLENAFKYTPSGGNISISISQNPKCYLLEISDSGIGIPPEEIGHIFDRFHRSKSTKQATGMGLGLAIVLAIANLYGAKVRVRSEVDRGSTFTVEFPRKLAQKR